MTDIPAAVRAVAPVYQRQFDRTILAKELASMIVFYDGMALEGYRAELDALRALPDPEGAVLEILRQLS